MRCSDCRLKETEDEKFKKTLTAGACTEGEKDQGTGFCHA